MLLGTISVLWTITITDNNNNLSLAKSLVLQACISGLSKGHAYWRGDTFVRVGFTNTNAFHEGRGEMGDRRNGRK